MSRKSLSKLGFVLVFLVLPACQVNVPDKITIGTGGGSTSNPTCTATPTPATVTSGSPVSIAVTASGNGPFSISGVGSFTSSTTLSRTYTNTTSSQVTDNDSVTVTDTNGNQGSCAFSVNVNPVGGSTPGAVSCVLNATPNLISVNGQVEFTATASGGTAPLTLSKFNPGSTSTTAISAFAQSSGTDQGTATIEYNAVGTPTASVTVTDANGNTATCQQSITVGLAPSISVQDSNTGTVASNQTVTLTTTTANFPGTPTITYTAQSSSGGTVSGVTIVPNSAGTSATVSDTSGAAQSFNVLVKAVSGSATASVLVPIVFSSTPAELVCDLTFPAGTYYVGNTVAFTVTAAEPVEITSVVAQNGTVTNSSLPNPFSVDFTGPGTGNSTVTVQAKGLVSGTVCNNGVAMTQTLYINPGSGGTGGSFSCNIATSQNPAISGSAFTATVTPSTNDGTDIITGIDTNVSVSGSWQLASGNNLAALVTISTVGTYQLSATITDQATGQTATCSLQQAIAQ